MGDEHPLPQEWRIYVFDNVRWASRTTSKKNLCVLYGAMSILYHKNENFMCFIWCDEPPVPQEWKIYVFNMGDEHPLPQTEEFMYFIWCNQHPVPQRALQPAY